MKSEMNKTTEILEHTPGVLSALLQDISDDWVYHNEGAGTWSAADVVWHLIVCEKINFMRRIEIILAEHGDKTFEPIDLDVKVARDQGKTINLLLQEFEQIRKANMLKLASFDLTESDLLKMAIHPTIGEVTLGEVMATWVAHDLNHIAQITRVMAKQYKEAVGPFMIFLNILK